MRADEEITKLKECIADVKFAAESAVTQSELLLAAEASRAATEELNVIGDAIRSASDETSATMGELAGEGTAASVESMSKEELVNEVIHLRKKVAQLDDELQTLKAAKKPQSIPTLETSGKKLVHVSNLVREDWKHSGSHCMSSIDNENTAQPTIAAQHKSRGSYSV